MGKHYFSYNTGTNMILFQDLSLGNIRMLKHFSFHKIWQTAQCRADKKETPFVSKKKTKVGELDFFK